MIRFVYRELRKLSNGEVVKQRRTKVEEVKEQAQPEEKESSKNVAAYIPLEELKLMATVANNWCEMAVYVVTYMNWQALTVSPRQ